MFTRFRSIVGIFFFFGTKILLAGIPVFPCPLKPFEITFLSLKRILSWLMGLYKEILKTLLGISLPVLSVLHPQILSAVPNSPPFPPQLALKGWESRRWCIILPV